MNIKHGSMLGNKGDDQNSLHVTFYECYFLDGHSREPKVDAGRVHLVNCVWYNSNGYSYYGVRALSTTTELGTARPEVLVEAAYVEAIDRIYRMEGLDDDTRRPHRAPTTRRGPTARRPRTPAPTSPASSNAAKPRTRTE